MPAVVGKVEEAGTGANLTFCFWNLNSINELVKWGKVMYPQNTLKLWHIIYFSTLIMVQTNVLIHTKCFLTEGNNTSNTIPVVKCGFLKVGYQMAVAMAIK